MTPPVDLSQLTPICLPVSEWQKVIQALQFGIPDPDAWLLAEFLMSLGQRKTPSRSGKMTFRVTKRQSRFIRRAQAVVKLNENRT